MATIVEQVEMTKEAREISKEVATLLKKVKAAKDAGLGLAGIVSAVAGELTGIVSAVEGYDQLPVEAKQLEPFLKAWLVGGAEVALQPPPPHRRKRCASAFIRHAAPSPPSPMSISRLGSKPSRKSATAGSPDCSRR